MVFNFNKFEMSPFIVFWINLLLEMTIGEHLTSINIDIMTLNSYFSVSLDKSISSDDNRRTFYQQYIGNFTLVIWS